MSVLAQAQATASHIERERERARIDGSNAGARAALREAERRVTAFDRAMNGSSRDAFAACLVVLKELREAL